MVFAFFRVAPRGGGEGGWLGGVPFCDWAIQEPSSTSIPFMASERKSSWKGWGYAHKENKLEFKSPGPFGDKPSTGVSYVPKRSGHAQHKWMFPKNGDP